MLCLMHIMLFLMVGNLGSISNKRAEFGVSLGKKQRLNEECFKGNMTLALGCSEKAENQNFHLA